MAININTGFHLGAALPIDDRAYLTKVQMLAVNENIYPDYFLTVCADDGFVYMFDKNMEDEKISAETGKFKLFAGDVEEAIAILNGDVDTEGSVLHSIKFNAANALVHPEEITTYTVSAAGHDDVVLTAEEKAAVDTGTAYSVDDTWQIEKVDEGYKFVDKNGVEASVDATVTETKTTPTTTIAEAIEELAESAEVTLKAYSTEAEGVTEGYLKTYEIFQGEESVGKIDIPKDLVVTEGSVIEITAIEPVDPETEITYKVGDETYKAADVADEESKWYGYPTAAGTFIKLIVANQKLPIFIDAKDLVDTGSLGKVTEDVTANVEVGGIAVGDVVEEGTDITELVKQLIIKYYEPEIKLDGSVTNKVQRVGTTLNDVVLTATVTKKSLDITKVTIDGTETTEGVAEGGDFTKTIDEISDTTEFEASVTDGKKEVTAKVKYEFVLPYMHGVSAKNTIETDADLEALTEVVEKKGTKTFAYTADNQYCVFVMPAEYADLKSILDPSKFENLSSWTKSTYTNAAGEEYKVYITNTKVTCTAFKYTFS